jgi:hypothetical protein
MVRRLVGTALLLPLAAAMGCDTTQPTAKSAKPAQVYFRSVADAVPLFEVWDASKVTVKTYPDQPGRPPDQTVENLGLWCDINTNLAQKQSANYPLRFSVSIERIRAGTSTPEPLTDVQYADALGSVTPYDDAAPETPATHGGAINWSIDLSNPSEPNTTVVVSLKNGRRISAASRDYIEKEKVPSGTYGSLCPSPTAARQLGNAGVAGSPGFFAIDVNAGDTIVVKARKDDNPLTTALFLQGTTFESQFYLEGRNVSTSLTGNTFSPKDSQDGISYAFTLR